MVSRRQLLLDVVGTLRGLVRLLAAYPRVGRGAGPDVEQLWDVVDPGPIAACLDATAAVFPQQTHAACSGGQEVQGGDGSSSSGAAGSGGSAVLPSLRWLLGKGGPLEVDGGRGWAARAAASGLNWSGDGAGFGRCRGC